MTEVIWPQNLIDVILEMPDRERIRILEKSKPA